MLFRSDILQGIAEGRVTLAYTRTARSESLKVGYCLSPRGRTVLGHLVSA